MAMKPAGKAIMVGVIAAAAGLGIWFSGALNKLPETAKAPAPAEQAVVPQVPPAPVEAAAPAPAYSAPAAPTAQDAALDALINKAKK